MRNQKGFTLIELVVVIVILGILAAIAVPKFIDMQVDARISAMNGLAGSVRSAVALSHAQALVKNENGATGTITMEGQDISMVFGYPAEASAAAGEEGIDGAINIDGFTYVDTTGVFTLNGAPAACAVVYNQATSATAPATVVSTAVTTANCQ
ncbi:prepilin-type N-terminal cleavage/methylation domain-containing protein [Deltaproteobacteria bacterium]|nr:prepilin-type N-terminal cleavage/methylation domain-containing protein [Deltaproteobacteria bacterium]